MYFVFLTFNVCSLLLNQIAALLSSILDLSIRSNWLMSHINNSVSSANRDEKNSVAFGKSFINERNRRSPNTVPWGDFNTFLFL